MIDDLTIKMTGFEAAERILDTMPTKVRKRVIKQSLRRGAAVYQKGAKANVPSRTGKLKRSIKVRSGRGLITQVYVAQDPGWYAHLVERGVKRHSLARGANLSRGKKQDVGRIHPGFRGRFFMQRAADAQTEAAITAVANRFEELLLKELSI